MVESAREVCSSMRVGRGNPKSVWCKDQVKAAVRERREELGARDEDAKERFLEVYKEEREGLKGVHIEAMRHFGRKMNQE